MKLTLAEARQVALVAKKLGVELPEIGRENFFGEGDVYLIALDVIRHHPGCDTTFLREQVKRRLALSEADEEPLWGRSGTRIDQIIRNLICHRTLQRFGHASRNQEGGWRLTLKGHRVFQKLNWPK
ncbi:hypothetical protein J7L13_01910 [bacterium]|nr:hypothetical protein [bacterium]